MTKRAVERPFRVPFVRTCSVAFGGEQPFRAMVVNTSVLGCYVASDVAARTGLTLRLRFTVPGNVIESEIVGAVVWLNPKQEHPVHSLPPGFGVRFMGLDPENRRRLEAVVADYLARFPER